MCSLCGAGAGNLSDRLCGRHHHSSPRRRTTLFSFPAATMAHLLTDIANYFNLDEINIDNWTFKLYYKVSFVICMTGATVGIASQYFGDPIRYINISPT